jgi:Collagen triple helix repeat (20 copies)
MILNFPPNPSPGTVYLGPNGVGYTFDGIKWIISSGNGPSGPSGPAGNIGPSGPSGANSTVSGPSGPRGFNGNQGPSGSQGPTGPSGANGDPGPSGANGDPGPSGANGDPGPSGANGDPGPTGPSGANGDPGPTGPSGANGDPGPTGPSGANGDPGPTGPSGANGDPGPTGPSGPAGSGGGSNIVKTILLRHVANTATITGPADINAWSASYTSTSNKVEIMAFVTVSNNGLGAEPKYLHLKRDGSIVDTIAYFFTGNAHYSIGPFYYLDTSASGSHTYGITLGTSGEIASTADSCLMIATEY